MIESVEPIPRDGSPPRGPRREPAPSPLCLSRRAFLASSALVAYSAGASQSHAIDLADDFARLQEREYFLRIGIVENGSAAVAVPSLPARIIPSSATPWQISADGICT